MMAGLISKGNADGLERALQQEHELEVKSILNRWKNEAHAISVANVLISAEALAHQLAKQKQLDILKRAAANAGFEKIYALGFFRDLPEHALSTYKHRAKSGRIPDYKTWLAETYETPGLLVSLSHIKASNESIHWTFRKSRKNSEFMKKAFFEDWLNIAAPGFKGKESVNESVSLSEVQLLNQLYKYSPLLMDHFIQAFKFIPKEEKADDLHLDADFKRTAIKKIIESGVQWNLINDHLPVGEHLILGEDHEDNLPVGNNQLVLTVKQVAVFEACIRFPYTREGRVMFFRRRLVKIIPDLIVKLLLRR